MQEPMPLISVYCQIKRWRVRQERHGPGCFLSLVGLDPLKRLPALESLCEIALPPQPAYFSFSPSQTGCSLCLEGI